MITSALFYRPHRHCNPVGAIIDRPPFLLNSHRNPVRTLAWQAPATTHTVITRALVPVAIRFPIIVGDGFPVPLKSDSPTPTCVTISKGTPPNTS